MSEGRCSSAICIVCERGAFWATHLRRLLREADVTVRSCGPVAQCGPILQRYPSSILLLEAGPGELVDVLELTRNMNSHYPLARITVALPRRCRRQQWALREVGAIHVIESTRELESVARLVRRHVQQAPPVSLTWVEQVRARLPWSFHA